MQRFRLLSSRHVLCSRAAPARQPPRLVLAEKSAGPERAAREHERNRSAHQDRLRRVASRRGREEREQGTDGRQVGKGRVVKICNKTTQDYTYTHTPGRIIIENRYSNRRLGELLETFFLR